MNVPQKTRRALAVVLFLAIVATAWQLLHQAQHSVTGAAHQDLTFNPGYQHAQRLRVAAARAAMDALGMAATGKQHSAEAVGYQQDYRLQRMQIQADSEGLDRWAAKDRRSQGLLLEIRASLVEFKTALDQAAGTAPPDSNAPAVPLLPALNRAESAFSNYAASLAEPPSAATTHYLFTSPVLLWWLLILLLAESAVLTWIAISATPSP